jgi:tetratricopeptide (TPR) repeat protein
VIYRRLGVRRLEAAALNNLGWVLVGLGEYEEALSHYKRSLKLAQKLGDRASIGVKLANIGQTYGDLGDFERARRYLDKALDLHQALSDGSGMADALVSLGQAALRQGQSGQAIELIERALPLARSAMNRYQEIRALVYLALALEGSGRELERARSIAAEAIRFSREAGIKNGEAYGLAAQALCQLHAGKLVDALGSARAAAALTQGRDVDSPEEIWFVLWRVAERASEAKLASEALLSALRDVERKRAQLRDPTLRALHQASSPARDILAAAKQAGLTALPEKGIGTA